MTKWGWMEGQEVQRYHKWQPRGTETSQQTPKCERRSEGQPTYVLQVAPERSSVGSLACRGVQVLHRLHSTNMIHYWWEYIEITLALLFELGKAGSSTLTNIHSLCSSQWAAGRAACCCPPLPSAAQTRWGETQRHLHISTYDRWKNKPAD